MGAKDWVPCKTLILNARSERAQQEVLGGISLGGPGFTLVHHETNVNFYDDVQVRTRYYAEAEALCKKITGAAHCKVMMGHRRSLFQKIPKYMKRPGYGLVAHCDFQRGFDAWFAGVLDGHPASGYEWQDDGDKYDDDLVRKEWKASLAMMYERQMAYWLCTCGETSVRSPSSRHLLVS